VPFKVNTFQHNAELQLPEPVRSELVQACQVYKTLTQANEKTKSIYGMMAVLDRDVNPITRQAIMAACGHACIGQTTIKRARRLQTDAQDLDELLDRLNQAHIGGGHLQREGDVVHATYDRCYCGSVNKSKQPFSPTYCACSCGWYQKLFEELLNTPTKVELLSSIIQGDDSCQFLIHI
jgi:predicted hydrocarbon binding protein